MTGAERIDILTRVEGHGRVELVRSGERVVGAHLQLYESPRFFEALLTGRRFDEVADIACRICSICSTAHKVAALQAIEQAMSLQVSPQTDLLRQLAVQGGQIESHALHLFCLALPDPLGVDGFPGMAAVAPEQLARGLQIKALGNLIQENVGGRAIHPFNLLPGGMGTVPAADQLQLLAELLTAALTETQAAIPFIAGLREVLPPLTPLPTCAVSGGPPLFGRQLTTSDGAVIPAGSASAWLNEQIEPYSNAKVSRFDGTNAYLVGPLARLQSAPSSGYSKRLFNAAVSASPLARAIELHGAVEQALNLIHRLLADGLRKEAPVPLTPKTGEGTALLEAPRGVLLHHYHFDSRGSCTAADIITPTAINQAAMEVSLTLLIAALDGAGHAEVKSACEYLIRCFDPCISCAVH